MHIKEAPPIKNRQEFEVSLSELFKKANLDYTRLIVEGCGGQGIGSMYELSAKTYLGYAKEDYSDDNRRSRINAVTNAKRAIDCQVDDILNDLGYNVKKAPSTYVKQMVDIFCDEESKKVLKMMPKLAFIAALNIAPMVLIAEMRSLRNTVEHSFIDPKKRDVKKAIEVAELFINATQTKFFDSEGFYVTDTKLKSKEKYGRITGFDFDGFDGFEGIRVIHFDEDNNLIEWKCKIDKSHLAYWLTLRMQFSLQTEIDFKETFIEFLKLAQVDIPFTKIKFKDAPWAVE